MPGDGERPASALPVVAHRGWSGRFPESTAAAYRAAIDYAENTGVRLGLECDVHFSADDELVCLHDLTLDRTSNSTGRAAELAVEQLRSVRFGFPRGRTDGAVSDLVTLRELMTWTHAARDHGVDVHLVIETKHPNPRGLRVEDRVAELLVESGWDAAGSPVRVISFSAAALQRIARRVPDVPRGLLVEKRLGVWTDGHLPDGVDLIGPDLQLVKANPDYVSRVLDRGHELNVWTVNDPLDVAWCRELGVAGFTTDHPDRVFEALNGPLVP